MSVVHQCIFKVQIKGSINHDRMMRQGTDVLTTRYLCKLRLAYLKPARSRWQLSQRRRKQLKIFRSYEQRTRSFASQQGQKIIVIVMLFHVKTSHIAFPDASLPYKMTQWGRAMTSFLCSV